VSVQLFRRHAKPLLIISALITIPQLLLGIAMSSTMPQVDATLPEAELAGAMTWVALISFVSFAWLCVGFSGIVLSASSAYLTDIPAEPAPALRAGLARTWRLLMANFLGYLRALFAALLVMLVISIPMAFGAALITTTGPVVITLVTALLLLVATFVFCSELGRAMLITPLIMLEDRGIFDSLRRSRRLSSGFVMRLASLVFISIAIYFAVIVGVLALGQMLLGNVVSQVLSSLLFVPFYPALACLTVALYYDLKVRKEGLDLELLTESAPQVLA